MNVLDLQPLSRYLLLVTIVAIAGIGPGWTLTPRTWRSDRLLVLPALGLAMLILLASTCNLLGLRMVIAGPVVLVVLCAWSVLVGLRHRGELGRALLTYRWLVVGAVVAGTTVLWSAVWWRTWNPYNDAFTYVSIADYLLQHSFATPVRPDPAFPSTTQVALYQIGGYRMGANYFLAFAAAILNLPQSFDAYLPALGVGTFTATLATAGVARRGFLYQRGAASVAGWLYGMHGGMVLATAVMGFFPQSIGMPLFLGYLSVQAAVRPKAGRWPWRPVVGSALLFGTLVLTYLESAPFAALSALAIGAVPSLWRPSMAGLSRVGLSHAIPAIGGLLLVPYTTWKAPVALLRQASAVVGWDPRLGVFDYLFVLTGFSPWFRSVALQPGLLHTAARAVALVLPCLALAVWARTLPVRRERLRAAACLAAVLIFTFAAAAHNPFEPSIVGQPWSTLKVVSYYGWLYPIALALALGRFQYSGWPLRLLAGLILIGLSGAGFVVAAGTARWAASPMRLLTRSEDPIAEYKRLPTLAPNPPGTPVNLVMPMNLDGNNHRRWVTYFLNAPVVTDWSQDGYIWPHLEPADRKRPVDPRLPMLVYAPGTAGSVAGMALDRTTVLFSEGWYGPESNETSVWQWLESTGTLTLSLAHDAQVFFKGDLAITGPVQRTVTLDVQGPATAHVARAFPEQWFTPVTFGPFTLPRGAYQLTLTADGLPTQLGPNDPRRVRLALRDPSVVVQPVDRQPPLR